VPTGVGVPRAIETGISRPTGALFVPPDGRRVFVWGVEPDGQLTPYRVVPVEPGPADAASGTLTSSRFEPIRNYVLADEPSLRQNSYTASTLAGGAR
jgi:hypothetical protein